MAEIEQSPHTVVWRVLLLGAFIAFGALVFLALAAPATAQEGQQWNNDYCFGCHDTASLPITFPSGDVVEGSVDKATYDASVHGEAEIPCVLCHADIETFPHPENTAQTAREYGLEMYASCFNCHQEQYTETRDNAHTAAIYEGNPEAAVCTDCHGAHDVQHPSRQKTEIPLTCRSCHSEIYDLYAESVHGAALFEEGCTDVPTCTDCHGIHDLEGPNQGPFHLFSPRICEECHADQALMDTYGISTNVFDSYLADFHGTTVILYEDLAPDQETNKPVCVDCHGVHHILPPDEVDSTVFGENLLGTCQRCHPDATANFPASWLSHYEPTLGKAPLVFGVNLFYQILIPGVIGAMLLWVLIDAFRRMRGYRERTRDV
jgi:hypothetical protein